MVSARCVTGSMTSRSGDLALTCDSDAELELGDALLEVVAMMVRACLTSGLCYIFDTPDIKSHPLKLAPDRLHHQ